MKMIVLTGGPGAGKTAILELSRKLLGDKAVLLPESASIIFGGGFPRLPSITGRSAAQRAIYHVQAELENMAREEKKWNFGLCDRGTLDSLAYWPNGESAFWKMADSTKEKEYSRYFAVIHLRSPTDQLGYNHVNPLRIETAGQAIEIDDRIADIWKDHPRYHSIPASQDFLTKTQTALDLISNYQKI